MRPDQKTLAEAEEETLMKRRKGTVIKCWEKSWSLRRPAVPSPTTCRWLAAPPPAAALGPDCASAKPPARPGGRRRTTQAHGRAARSAHAPRRKRFDVITGRLCARGKMAEQVTKSVLFVCLGNICRSPIAEAAFRKLVTDQNISDNRRTDSAAACTCELGSPPDYRGRFA